MKPRNDQEAIRALSRLTNYERTRADGPRDFDLSRPRALLAALGSPDRRIGSRVIQVAGTKGKGSTARFLDSILRTAGLRTGCYTSPHLEHVRERISVDGVPIPEADFAACVGEVLETVSSREVETTFFESMLAIACLQFARAGTEAVVLEVGLGGRLDATTAVPCTTNVITEISLEHTEILGDTVELVAAEKAGTIRPGIPLITGVDPESPAGRVICRIADERGAPWTYVPRPVDVNVSAAGLSWNGYDLHVLGRHQAHNAALAVAAVADLPTDVIRRGLAAARQPGCCEPAGARPTVVIDGAHTVESIEATLRAVEEHFPDRRAVLLLALAQDKNLDRIAAALAPRVGAVFCTLVDDKRGRAAEELAAHAAWNGRAQAIPDALEALAVARRTAGPDGLVLATGSLYLAGALRSHPA